MKRIIKITLFIFLLILISCKNDKTIMEPSNNEVEFVIIGTAKNGKGKKLGLYIPSLGMDNRMTSEIIDGKFGFKGSLPSSERAEIAFDNELDEFDGAYSFYEVFLTNDTLKINVTIDEKFENFYFSEKYFEDNGINTYYSKTKDKYNSPYKGLMYNRRDSVLIDSLKKHTFPLVRKKLIQANINLYSKKENTIIGLNNLKYMFEDRFIFDFEEMSDNEKKTITDYFNNIDKSLINNPDYTTVSSYIKRMNIISFGENFMDFTLPNIDKKNTQLSKIILDNEYTILDFWWSGCKPCRKFNQEGKEYYQKLKDRGIEIVSINVDNGMKKWQTATDKDKIEWINLYAGANSKIQADYNVVAFPTTIIFDNNKQKIDFEFHKVTDLLKLKSKK